MGNGDCANQPDQGLKKGFTSDNILVLFGGSQLDGLTKRRLEHPFYDSKAIKLDPFHDKSISEYMEKPWFLLKFCRVYDG